MKVTLIPALLQALSPQPTPPKTQGPAAALAAQQVLAARKAGMVPREAQATHPSNASLPSKILFDPKKSADTYARVPPRGSLLDIVV